MGRGKRGLCVVLAALLLSACRIGFGRGDGDAAGDGSWQVFSTRDGLLVVATPRTWSAQPLSANGLTLKTDSGRTIEIEHVDNGHLGGASQAQVLDGMLAAASEAHAREGRTVEEAGRRVWMGEHYIWHELHYITTWDSPCRGCQDGYAIDLLALPTPEDAVVVRYRGPEADPPTEEEQQTVLDVVNTISYGAVGTT